jgi:hypothetical protein
MDGEAVGVVFAYWQESRFTTASSSVRSEYQSKLTVCTECRASPLGAIATERGKRRGFTTQLCQNKHPDGESQVNVLPVEIPS